MEPAVKVVLTGDFPVYSTGDFEDTRFSWLQIEREARPLAEASPQLAEIPGHRSETNSRLVPIKMSRLRVRIFQLLQLTLEFRFVQFLVRLVIG